MVKKEARQLSAVRMVNPFCVRPGIVLLAPVLALAACGGGGGGSSSGQSTADAECQAFADLTGIDFGYLQQTGSCAQFDDSENDLAVLQGGDNAGFGTPLVGEPDPGQSSGDEFVPTLVPDDEATAAAATISLASLNAPAELSAGLADGPGSDFYVGANNSALLQGPVIGTGSTPNGSLSRSLPFQVDQSSDGLALLYASVSPRGDVSSSVTMVIENQSSELRCFVKLDELYFYDRSGQVLEETLDFAYADGTIASSSVTTDTCIESGQKAFLTNLTDGPADSMGGFVAGRLEGRLSSFVSEATMVKPLSYDIVDGELEVLIVNRGLVTVAIGFSRYVLVDANGAALATSLLHGTDTLAPGAEGVLTSRSIDFTGSVSSVRVIVDFEPSDS